MVSVKKFFFKHWAWIFLALAIFISFSLAAHAQTTEYSQDSGSSNFGYIWGNFSLCPTYTRGFYFTPSLTATVSDGDVYVGAYIGGASGVRFQIYAADGTTLLADGTGTGSSGGYVPFTFSSPVTLNSGTGYYFVPSPSDGSGGCSPIPAFNSLIGTNYVGGAANGYGYYFNGSGLYATDANYGGIFRFHLYQYVAPPTTFATLEFPSDAATSTPFAFWTPDFTNWVVSASGTSATSSYHFGVAYQNFNLPTSTPPFIDQVLAQFPNNGVTNYVIPKSHLLMGATTSTAVSWYAFAYLNNLDTGQIEAISPTFFFTVVDQLIAAPATTTAALLAGPFTPSYTTGGCDPNDNIVVFGICQLFLPGSNGISIFTQLGDKIKNKPPFGYFTLASQALANLQTGSSSLSLPDFTDFHVVFDPLRSGIGYLTWLTFVFWMFYKYRNVEL